MGYVNREAEPGDLVVVAPDYVERSAFAHYNAREDLNVEGFGLKITPKALKRIGHAVAEHDRVWVIVRAEEGEALPRTVKQIVAAAIPLPERAYHKRYNKVDLTLYERGS